MRKLIDWLIPISAVLYTLTLFSFWPVVDGNSARFAKAIADFRVGEKLEGENERFLAVNRRQNDVGLELIKLLRMEKLNDSEKARAQDLRDHMDRLYRSLAAINRNATPKIGRERAAKILDETGRRLRFDSPQLPPTPSRVCGHSKETLCDATVRRLPGAHHLTDVQERIREQHPALAEDLSKTVHSPLREAIENYLISKYGRELDPEAEQLATDIVMSIASNETQEKLLETLKARAERAEQSDQSARVQIALWACMDLNQALRDFLTRNEGRQLLRKLVNDLRAFEQEHRAETGQNFSAPVTADMKEAEIFIQRESLEDMSDLRQAVFRALPGEVPRGKSEAMWKDERASIAALIGKILKVACYEGITPAVFTERLIGLAS